MRHITILAEDKGRNRTERILSALKRQEPGFAKKPWAEQVNAVHLLKQDPEVVINEVGPGEEDLESIEEINATEARLEEELAALKHRLEQVKQRREQLNRRVNPGAGTGAGRATPPAALSTRPSTPLSLSARTIEVLTTDVGRNSTERLLSALRRQNPSFARRPWSDQMNTVHELRRDPSVEIKESE